MNKISRLFSMISAIGLALAASASLARAQSAPPAPLATGLPIPLTITGTISLQGAVTPTGGADNPTGFKYATAKGTITNAVIMQQIEVSFGNSAKDVPKGAKLVYNLDGDGTVSMTDAKGNELFNAAGILDIAVDPNGTGGAWSGTESETTGAQSYKGSYLMEIAYTDSNGNAFILTGLTTETYSISAPNAKTGNQTLSDSITVTGVGDGFISSPVDGSAIPGAGTGKMTGSAKGTLSGS